MGDGSNVLVRYAQLDEQAHLVLDVGEVIERTQLAGEARRYCIHLTLHLAPVLIGHIGAFGYADAHIAGYSYEGKINGTAMVVQAFARYFGIGELEGFAPEHTPVPQISFYKEDGRMRDRDEIASLLLERFPVYELDKALRSDPGSFEKIRAEYKYRREFRWR